MCVLRFILLQDPFSLGGQLNWSNVSINSMSWFEESQYNFTRGQDWKEKKGRHVWDLWRVWEELTEVFCWSSSGELRSPSCPPYSSSCDAVGHASKSVWPRSCRYWKRGEFCKERQPDIWAGVGEWCMRRRGRTETDKIEADGGESEKMWWLSHESGVGWADTHPDFAPDLPQCEC